MSLTGKILGAVLLLSAAGAAVCWAYHELDSLRNPVRTAVTSRGYETQKMIEERLRGDENEQK